MSWPYAYTPYIWPMLVTAAVLLVLAVYGWRHRTVPAALPLALGTLSWGIWALSSALELAATDDGIKFFWFVIQAILQLPASTFALLFVLAYAGLEKWFTRRNLFLLSLPCVIFAFLAVTNPAHHLLWSSIQIDQVITVGRGPAFWMGQLYAILLFPVQIGVLIWLLIRSPLHRLPTAVILAAQLLSRATYLLDVLRLNPFAPFDAFMLASTLAVWAYFLALFRFRVLRLIPIGRDSVIERMSDGMVVVDAENRIADFNPAAIRTLALSRRDTVGQPAAEALAGFPALLALLDQTGPGTTELQIKGESRTHYLQVHTSPLVHPRGVDLGRLILLEDVTEQRQARAELLEQQRALAALQERERLARELHDSTGQVLGYAAVQLEVIQDRLKEGRAALSAGRAADADGRLAEAEGHLARMSRIVQEAHADLRENILNLRVAPTDERPFFATLRNYLDGYSQNYGIQAELAVAQGVDEGRFDAGARLQLFRMIQEALSNARKHARATRVQLSIERQDRRVSIQIQDNGQGFDLTRAARADGRHYGLSFMRERAEELGGRLQVDSEPGRGTRIIVYMPIKE